MIWSEDAQQQLDSIHDESLRRNLAMRAEKKARSDKTHTVELKHIVAFLDDKMHWQAAALARLSRVPEGVMRDTTKERIEAYALANGLNEISLEIAEEGLSMARQAMERMMSEKPKTDAQGKKESICPFAKMAQMKVDLAQDSHK